MYEYDILTACTNLHEYIYKVYDRTQNDSMNPTRFWLAVKN